MVGTNVISFGTHVTFVGRNESCYFLRDFSKTINGLASGSKI